MRRFMTPAGCSASKGVMIHCVHAPIPFHEKRAGSSEDPTNHALHPQAHGRRTECLLCAAIPSRQPRVGVFVLVDGLCHRCVPVLGA